MLATLVRLLPTTLRVRLRALFGARLCAFWGRPTSADAGAPRYHLDDLETPICPLIDVLLTAGEVTREDVVAWTTKHTLVELRVRVFANSGIERFTEAAVGNTKSVSAALWFAAPVGLAALAPAHLETCLLVAAAEAVDAVTLVDAALTAGWSDSAAIDATAACRAPLRTVTLFRHGAFLYDPVNDHIIPQQRDLLVKLVHPTRGGRAPLDGPFRRGPYVTNRRVRDPLRVALRDAGRLRGLAIQQPGNGRTSRPLQPLLVTTSFLARGGAEHTLFETLKALRERFAPTFVTLAPHHPELGDRRPDFRTISERIYPLGDLVHPDAMLGILRALLDATGAQTLYNANGTTLFYPFARQLKRERPELRIVDHLYDHRVGYVDCYDDPTLLGAIDACVAENRQIHDRLRQRGWPAERVPVIWPCGRPAEALPTTAEASRLRSQLRGELGIADGEVVFLTAARMHPQKRPLDLIELAKRVSDTAATFVIAGGGPLEHEVDQAIAAAPGTRIRRLPFRDDIPSLIAAADVGCLVSDFEGLPVFLLECLQLGKPFLGTRVGELGDLLDETGAGVVVDQPGDLEALAAAVRTLCDHQQREARANFARIAGDRFGIVDCAERYAAVFEGRDQPC